MLQITNVSHFSHKLSQSCRPDYVEQVSSIQFTDQHITTTERQNWHDMSSTHRDD